MSQYYNSKRTKNIYDPNSSESFKLSRSKIDLFIECARCFYLDRKLGIGRPPGFPFNLNTAVDTLLKKEFDVHRANNTQHPLLEKYGVDAKPVAHEDLDIWRENFKGVQYLHKPTNFIITGAIDDLWINSKGEYIVVDYKSTSKAERIEALEQDWHGGYKRQMEIYQWLLRQNGYKVSNTGYFVYCNGDTDKEAFDGKLEFDITLIAYEGNDDWVEEVIKGAHKCLQSDSIPKAGVDCDYCNYRNAANEIIEKKSDEELLERAKEFVLENKTISAAMLQRKFKIGYSRAAIVLDSLEQEGIIGSAGGFKPRKVI